MKKALIMGYPFDQSRQFCIEFDSLEQKDLIKGFQRVIDNTPSTLLGYAKIYEADHTEDEDGEVIEKSNTISSVNLPLHEDGGPAYLDIYFKDGRQLSFHSTVVITIMNLL